MMPKWNVTAKCKQYKKSDVIVLSVAKSGRTWLRVLLNKYFCAVHDLPFSLKDLGADERTVPSIIYTHEIWDHYSKASLSQRLFGKYIVPDRILKTKRIIVLYRDPRDVIVSLFFQKTKRSNHKIVADLKAFLGNEQYGLSKVIFVLNNWRQRLSSHPNCLWISYEDLKKDTSGVLINTIGFLNLTPHDSCLNEAIEFSSFNNMKKLEKNGGFSDAILKPGNPSDPESFKVRKGKVGGYIDYFQPEALSQLDGYLSKLDPFFKYPGSRVSK
jgi:hypothetical protein